MNLSELNAGESARIVSVGGKGSLRQHFLDMGLIPGATIELVKYAPMGDPVEFRIHNYELTLRLGDAREIQIEDVRAAQKQEGQSASQAQPSFSATPPRRPAAGNPSIPVSERAAATTRRQTSIPFRTTTR